MHARMDGSVLHTEVPVRLLWEGLCRGVPVPEWSRLRAHHRAVHLPHRIHGQTLPTEMSIRDLWLRLSPGV